MKDKIPVCYNLTPPPAKDPFAFDPQRCKTAVETLADLVHDHGNGDDATALDNLVTDIEALHRAAQARDYLLEAVKDIPVYESNSVGVFASAEDVYSVIDEYQNYEYHEIADLNL